MLDSEEGIVPTGGSDGTNTQAGRPHRGKTARDRRHVNAIDAIMPNSPLETPWMDPPSMRPSGTSLWWRRFRAFLRERGWRVRALVPLAMIVLSAAAMVAGTTGNLDRS